MLHGEGRRLRSIGRAQLGHTTADMMSNRGWTDRQSTGNLMVRHPLDYQREHFSFALAHVVTQLGTTRPGLEHRLGYFRRKRGVPGVSGPNGVRQGIDRRVLHQIADGA